MKKQTIAPDKKSKRIDSEPFPKEKTGKDADDSIHSQQAELPTEAGEEDPDDVVHRPSQPRLDKIDKDNLEDPDDLVHGSKGR